MAAWVCGWCLIAGAACAGEAARPELPADMLVMLAVGDPAVAVRGVEDFARTVRPQDLAEREPGSLYAELLKGVPAFQALPAGAPVYLMLENFMPGAKPVVFGVAKLGDLGALDGEKGIEAEKPERDGMPWSLEAEGLPSLMAVPRPDGWTVLAADAAAARRVAGKIANWKPAPPQSAMELTVDFAKAVKLQKMTIDAGLGGLMVLLNMQLERASARVDELEGERAVQGRAAVEMGQRAMPILAPRLQDLAAALADCGIVRLRFDADAGQADIRTEWFPAPGGTMAKMVADIAAVKPVAPAALDFLPAEIIGALAVADTSAVDASKLDNYFVDLFGDIAYIVDGKDESRAAMKRSMQDLLDASRGAVVSVGGVSGDKFYTASLGRGAKYGATGPATVAVLKSFFALYLEAIAVAVPQTRDQIVVGLPLAPRDKIEGVGAQTLKMTVDFKGELADKIPEEIKTQLARSLTANEMIFSTSAVDGVWLNVGGPANAEGFAALVKSLKAKTPGFGKRAGFAEAAKLAGDDDAVAAGLLYPGAALKAAVPAIFAMTRDNAAFPEEARKVIDGIADDPAPLMFSETFVPGRATVRFNVPAVTVKSLFEAVETMDKGGVFRALEPTPPPQPQAPANPNPAPATEAGQNEVF